VTHRAPGMANDGIHFAMTQSDDPHHAGSKGFTTSYEEHNDLKIAKTRSRDVESAYDEGQDVKEGDFKRKQVSSTQLSQQSRTIANLF